VKHYAVRAGLDPAAYSGHSLRAGFLTSAAEPGASGFRKGGRLQSAPLSAFQRGADREVEDLSEVPDGLRVRIRRSKTDRSGEGHEIAIPRGYRLRPVEAVQTSATSSEPWKKARSRSGRIGCPSHFLVYRWAPM
jgi:hypothetical protein